MTGGGTVTVTVAATDVPGLIGGVICVVTSVVTGGGFDVTCCNR